MLILLPPVPVPYVEAPIHEGADAPDGDFGDDLRGAAEAVAATALSAERLARRLQNYTHSPRSRCASMAGCGGSSGWAPVTPSLAR